MKKMMLVLVLCIICAATAGCSMTGDAGTQSAAAEAATTAEPAGIDLDLSGMSGTVIYSQIYHLMSDPAPYMGKTIKIAGLYSVFEDTESGNVYHACIIPDATACCTQGIEFVRPSEYNWPADYPEDGSNIVVTGRLESYEEGGLTYLHLTDAQLEWQKDRDKQL